MSIDPAPSSAAGSPAASTSSSKSSSPGKPVLIIVMGTSGSGKSTLGSELGKALHIPFIDGDDLHPASNVEKMSKSIPLTDVDREPWLKKIRRAASELTNPASHHLARGLTRGHHKEEVLKRFLEVEMGEVDHVRKLAEVYETSAGEGSSPSEIDVRGEAAEAKFLHRDQHPKSDLPPDGQTRRGCVIACSALKRSYRQLLRGNIDSLAAFNTTDPQIAELKVSEDLDVYHVYMDISAEILWQRMQARQGHFMKDDMLKSQLETLEVPVETGDDLSNGSNKTRPDKPRGEPGIVVVPVQSDTTIEEVTQRAKLRIAKMVGTLV